jgi:hypothetical protein
MEEISEAELPSLEKRMDITGTISKNPSYFPPIHNCGPAGHEQHECENNEAFHHPTSLFQLHAPFLQRNFLECVFCSLKEGVVVYGNRPSLL